jgi:hypothetical protein
VAYTGSNAFAPPKTTANMSSVIAPSSTCRRQTNDTPSRIAATLTARRSPVWGRGRITASDPIAITSSATLAA